MLSKRRKNRGRLHVAVIIAMVLTALHSMAMADTPGPEEYMRTLNENIESYSRAASWRCVQDCLEVTEELLATDGNRFSFANKDGVFLRTDAVDMKIDGEFDENGINMLHVNSRPVVRYDSRYEYESFALQEIALCALFPDMDSYASSMCSYMFLYDVYPYAMWANDSELKTRTRECFTALDGRSLYIVATSSEDDFSIDMTVYVLGEAGIEQQLAAQENLNANYATESISTLIYELGGAQQTYAQLLETDPEGRTGMEVLSDMLSCCNDYWNLNTARYEKLKKNARVMDRCFLQLSVAINSEMSAHSEQNVSMMHESIEALREELRKMY